MIPFLKPNINDSDVKLMIKSIKTGWLVPGGYSRILEDKLKGYLKVKNVKLTNSCSIALELSLIMAGVRLFDEVITTPMSWVATSNAIWNVGAKPVFVDIDATGCLNPDLIEAKINEKTKAILVVHLYGQLADMKRINRIAKKHGLKVIEDAAHCLLPGIGTGDYACLSFHAAKNITCGQGGAIVSKHPIDDRLLYHGVEKIDGKRRMTRFGLKGEMTDFQAALLIGQLDRYEETLEKRKKVFLDYTDGLFFSGVEWAMQERESAYHQFVIFTENRDEIRKKLAKAGIETSIHYEPIHTEPYYKKLGYVETGCLAEEWGRKVISLPTYPDLDTKKVVKQLLKTL